MEFFFCRFPGCGYFGPPTHWAGTDLLGLGGHWKCPLCGGKYLPWAQRPGWCKANKLYVVEHQAAGLQKGIMETALAAAGIHSTMLPEVGGEEAITYLPFQWADTRTGCSNLSHMFRNEQLYFIVNACSEVFCMCI